MQYGNITIELTREPVQVGILVEGRQQSGPFIANHARRGVVLSDVAHQIRLPAAEALTMLAWLQEQAPALRAMIDEEAAALALVTRRQMQPETGNARTPSQAEGDRATVEADLRAKEADRQL